MKKFFWLFFFILFFSLPSTTSAYFYDNLPGKGNYSDLTFSIHTYNPDDTTNSESPTVAGKMVVNITARDSSNQVDRFDINTPYSIEIWPEGDPNNKCYSMSGGITSSRLPYTISTKPSSAKEINFTVDFSRVICNKLPGKFNLIFWVGNQSRTDNASIIDQTAIYIDQANLGVFDLKPFSTDANANLICPNRKPAVALLGSKKGNRYTFWWDGAKKTAFQVNGTDQPSMTVEVDPSSRNSPDQYKLCMEPDGWGIPLFNTCRYAVDFTLPSDPVKQCAANGTTCNVNLSTERAGENKYGVNAIGENYTPNQAYRIDFLDKQTGQNVVSSKSFTADGNGRMNVSLGTFAAGNYGLYVYNANDSVRVCPNDNVVVNKDVGAALPAVNTNTTKEPTFQSTQCVDGKCAKSSGEFCNTGTGKAVVDGDPISKGDGILTVVGCVPTDPSRFIAGLMKYITGFSGGIALLLMAFGSFQMITSAGNADSLKKGREQFVSAVIGLLFIIFATLLMQIIGVDILGLPGFSK